MALKIRLARGGAKKRPFYSIVVADSRSPRDGRFIEKLGYYNPLLPREHEDRLKLDTEKVQAWMAKGARPSERVYRFLSDAGLAAPVQHERPKKSAPKAKARERMEAARQKAEEAAAADAAPAGAAAEG